MSPEICPYSPVDAKNFFSETGISILNTAIAFADAVQHSSEFDPLKAFETETGPVISDLEAFARKFCCGGKKPKVRGSVGLAETVLQPQWSVKLHPIRLFSSLVLWRWEMSNILTSIINCV